MPEGAWSAYYRDTCAAVVIPALFQTISKPSQPGCPLTGEEVKNLPYACSSEIGHKEERELLSVTPCVQTKGYPKDRTVVTRHGGGGGELEMEY